MVAPRLSHDGVSALARPAIVLLVCFSLLTGLAYPLVVHLIGQTLFPRQANGTLVQARGQPVGSALIGQPFSGPAWFHGRPSATMAPYHAAASSGSNLGPTNPALRDAIAARAQAYGGGEVPIDLLTSSASGLDPHVSPAAAYLQVERVARARGLDPGEVRRLVDRTIEAPTLGVLGEARVNVLRLNLALPGVK